MSPNRWIHGLLLSCSILIVAYIEFAALYTIYPWADTLAHLSAGIALGGIYTLSRERPEWSHTLVVVCVCAIGWELIELVLPGFSGLFALGLTDTAVDVVATVTGGVIAHAMMGRP